MTVFAVVARRVADGGRDGVDYGGGLVRVTRCPHRDQDDDYPSGELAPESAALAFVSATSHSVFLRVVAASRPHDTWRLAVDHRLTSNHVPFTPFIGAQP